MLFLMILNIYPENKTDLLPIFVLSSIKKINIYRLKCMKEENNELNIYDTTETKTKKHDYSFDIEKSMKDIH